MSENHDLSKSIYSQVVLYMNGTPWTEGVFYCQIEKVYYDFSYPSSLLIEVEFCSRPSFASISTVTFPQI